MKVLLNIQNNNKSFKPEFMRAKISTIDSYEIFYKNITKTINKNYELDMENTCNWFYKLANEFFKEGNIVEFTRLSKGLIEILVSKNYDNLAGIFCSILIKFNKDIKNEKNVEDLAIRGVAIARRTNDAKHIAARAYDINRMLMLKAPGSDKHIKYLKIQNEALEHICQNYEEEALKLEGTPHIKLAPLKNYEDTLFNVKLEIAIYALFKDSKYAVKEFENAKKLFEKIKIYYTQSKIEKIQKKFSELEKKYKMCGLL